MMKKLMMLVALAVASARAATFYSDGAVFSLAERNGAFEDFRLGVRGVPGWIFLSSGRNWK